MDDFHEKIMAIVYSLFYAAGFLVLFVLVCFIPVDTVNAYVGDRHIDFGSILTGLAIILVLLGCGSLWQWLANESQHSARRTELLSEQTEMLRDLVADSEWQREHTGKVIAYLASKKDK